MRPLTGAQQAAIGQASPLVQLELIDWAPHYAAVFSGNPTAGRTAACLALDGSLVQAYNDLSGHVYARRVTDPTQPSWGAWTTIASTANTNGVVALCALPDRERLIWQDSATTQLYYADTLNNGVSWSIPAALFDPGAAVSGLAADAQSTQVFVSYQVSGLWRIALWSLSGSWAKADWPNGDSYAINGLGAVYTSGGSYLVAIAMQATASAGVALNVYTYSGIWSAPAVVAPADIGAGLALQDPHITSYDGLYHVAYGLVDSGAVTGLPSARTALSHSLDGVHWTDPLEDAGSYVHGAVPLKHATGYLLAAPDTSALAPLYTGSASQYRDCTADLSKLEVVQKDGEPAHVVLTLQNDVGQYDALPALRSNARLRLSLGYAGTGVVPAFVFYVDDWSFVGGAGESELVVTASDGRAWLERQSRATLLYSGKTVAWLALEILARAGLLAVTLPTTPQFSQAVPSFAIAPGATWRTALDRLSRLYGFDAAVRTLPNGTDGAAVIEKNPGDAAVWSYGTEVEQFVIARSGDRANHVLAYGAPAAGGPPIGEAWDWADVESTGQERYLHVVEPQITTRSEAAIRAGLELNREVRRGQGGSLSVALHPGLELWDVVGVTAGGLSAATLRVATLHHIYEPQPGAYDLVLTLEGP